MINKIIALLPIKQNSERVPNKNIRDFSGKPLFHYIIEILLHSKWIEAIYIDTDSDFIANKSQENFPVKIIERPLYLQGDSISVNKLIEYDLSKIDGNFFLQTHCTNPLIKTETINRAIEKFFHVLDKGYDSLFSVTRLQTRLYDHKRQPINFNPNELQRTQDLPPVFEDNSCFYLFSRNNFMINKNRIGIKPYMLEIDRLEAIDIDEEMDFLMAEQLYKIINTQ